ncbi:MAG: hypothetical protein M5U28_22025 [Sandaracinaceae bacterium]|nr:hypothetical protein [Sandaracinaceae bacterium]
MSGDGPAARRAAPSARCASACARSAASSAAIGSVRACSDAASASVTGASASSPAPSSAAAAAVMRARARRAAAARRRSPASSSATRARRPGRASSSAACASAALGLLARGLDGGQPRELGADRLARELVAAGALEHLGHPLLHPAALLLVGDAHRLRLRRVEQEPRARHVKVRGRLAIAGPLRRLGLFQRLLHGRDEIRGALPGGPRSRARRRGRAGPP